jgi:hypothetical protein
MQRSLYDSLQRAARFGQPSYGKLLFLQGLCFAIGFGVKLDYEAAINLVFEAAKANYRPAKYTYRRLHQAIFTLKPHRRTEGSFPSVDALEEIDPDLQTRLLEIERSYPNDYLPCACRLSEKQSWRERTLRSCPTALTYFTEARIQNSSTEDTLRSLRTEIISLSAEGWNAHQTDRSYPIDYLLALSIVFDDAGSSLFKQIAEPFSRILETWDFHLSGFSVPISPLFLASRVGNVEAVRHLIHRGASSRYKSYLGMIPLHFLFLFDDQYTAEMAALLSAGLSSADSYYAANTCIPEQLCSLVGTPLAFNIQVTHQKSIDILMAMENSSRSSYTLEYQGGPGHFLPGLSSPMEHWQNLGQVFDRLARLQPLLSTEQGQVTTLTQVFSRPPGTLDLSIMLLMVIRAWHMHRISHWVMHGNLYQSRLEQTIEAIADTMISEDGFESHYKIILALQVPLLVVPSFRNENLLYALGTRLRSSLGPEDFENRVAPLLARQIEESLYSLPHMLTMIGLFPRPSPTPEQLYADLMLSYRCHDSAAFSRILSHAFAYSMKNEAEFALHCIAVSPSQDAATFLQLFNRYSTAEQTPPEMIQSAVQLALRHGNNDALEAFFNVYGVSCLVGRNNVNIFHLLCTEDGFDALLDHMLTFLGSDVSWRLLHSRDSVGSLRPVQVALHSGSCKCIRTLLRRYSMDEGAFGDLADALLELPFDFQLVLTQLMRHFLLETWYLKRFLRWYTDVNWSISSNQVVAREDAIQILAHWHFEQEVALHLVGDCLSEMRNMEQEGQHQARQALEARL